MPTFKVLRRVDAFADYVAEVEAADAVEAAQLAYEDERKYEWQSDGVQQFDARVLYTLDENGREIAESEAGNL